MSDNISRQAVLSILNGFEVMDGHTDQQRAIHMVELLPSTDRKGEWKEDETGNGFWICSSCGFVSEASGAWLLYKHCPHCGADMRGVDNESTL